MGDWPAQSDISFNRGIISNADPNLPLSQLNRTLGIGLNSAASTWTAQRAVYAPILVQKPVTVTNLIASVATQAGNWNMGIYEEDGSSIVLGTKAAVPVAGVGSFNITDTALDTGFYFIALWCDSSTAVFHSGLANPQVSRTLGLQQQTGLATDLPATATFATYAVAVCPYMAATLKATF